MNDHDHATENTMKTQWTFELTIKGHRFQAAGAAADRGIAFAFGYEKDFGPEIKTVGRANAYRTDLDKWARSTLLSKDLPGALLDYSELPSD